MICFSILSFRNHQARKRPVQTMNTHQTDVILYRRRNRARPPSVLLIRVPDDRDHRDQSKDNRDKNRPIPHMVGLRVSNLDLHDNSTSSFGWQRSSEKFGRMSPAPDVVYRNRFHEKSEMILLPRRKSTKSNSSFSSFSSKPSAQPKHTDYLYKTIYNRLREIEQQENPPVQLQRPLNEDQTFRRIIGEKKSPVTKYSYSTAQSTFFPADLKSPESFVNYMNYSRRSQSTTSSWFY